jgi:hypothetical protein
MGFGWVGRGELGKKQPKLWEERGKGFSFIKPFLFLFAKHFAML